MNVLEKNLIPESINHPIIFEDIFIKKSSQEFFIDEK
jgi:hypothetical protein